MDERRREEQGDGAERKEDGEEPCARAAAKVELGAQAGTLYGDADRLQGEVEGGEAVTTAGGDGDDEIMDEAGGDEGGEHCAGGAERAAEGAEEQIVGELVEAGVPAVAPEIGEAARAERAVHERLGIDG